MNASRENLQKLREALKEILELNDEELTLIIKFNVRSTRLSISVKP